MHRAPTSQIGRYSGCFTCLWTSAHARYLLGMCDFNLMHCSSSNPLTVFMEMCNGQASNMSVLYLQHGVEGLHRHWCCSLCEPQAAFHIFNCPSAAYVASMLRCGWWFRPIAPLSCTWHATQW